MNDFNELENAVLGWFQIKFPDTILSQQITTAKFSRREWTKVGFYVYFTVNTQIEKLDCEIPINGPNIESKDIEYVGITMLWANEGYIHCLEMASCGHYFREKIQKFTLFD